MRLTTCRFEQVAITCNIVTKEDVMDYQVEIVVTFTNPNNGKQAVKAFDDAEEAAVWIAALLKYLTCKAIDEMVCRWEKEGRLDYAEIG